MYLEICKIISQRSTCLKRHIGCVITLDDRIISTGYNGSPKGLPHCTSENCNDKSVCPNAVHAELNAIAFAAKEGISLKGSTLYCSLTPCVNCAKIIIQSGIKCVIYEEAYDKIEGLQVLNDGGIGTTHFMNFTNREYKAIIETYINIHKGNTEYGKDQLEGIRKRENTLKLMDQLEKDKLIHHNFEIQKVIDKDIEIQKLTTTLEL